MSLRLRLIVAFFLFSVVPLAAVTFYSYTSNLRALQVAAQHETEMLTGELTQRMQVVTTQISDRVEHLMDMPVARPPRRRPDGDDRQDPDIARSSTRTVVAQATPARRGAAPPAAPAAPPAPSAPATAVAVRAIDPNSDRSAGRRRARRSRHAAQQRRSARHGRTVGGRGPARDRHRQARAPSVAPAAADGSLASRGRRAEGSGEQRGARDRCRIARRRWMPRGRQGDGRRGGGRAVSVRMRPPPSGTPRRGSGVTPPPAAAGTPDESNADPTHLKMDLAPIRRELFREMAPNGTFEQMTPEERAAGRTRSEPAPARDRAGPATERRRDSEEGRGAAQQAAGAAAAATAGAAASPAVPPVARTAPAAPRRRRRRPPPLRRPPRTAAARAPQCRQPTPCRADACRTGPAEADDAESRADRDATERENGARTARSCSRSTPRSTCRTCSPPCSPTRAATAARFRSPSARTGISTRRTRPIARSSRRSTCRASTTARHQACRQLDRRHHAGPSGAGLRFGIARPVGNLLNDLRRTTARNAGFGLLFIAIALAGMVPMSGRLDPQSHRSLTDGVGRIAQGDYARACR